MTDPDDATEPRAPLPVGTSVEVRTGFDDSWTTGFAVEKQTAAGYRLSRRGDREVLPTEFAPDAVRREPKTSRWWY